MKALGEGIRPIVNRLESRKLRGETTAMPFKQGLAAKDMVRPAFHDCDLSA